MQFLSEIEALKDISLLQNLWDSDSFFCFLPQSSDVAKNSVLSNLDCIPNHIKSTGFGLLTSGSTGKPKIVIGNKVRSERLSILLHSLQDSEPVSNAICTLPLSYTYSFINQWLWSRMKNRQLVLTHGFREPDNLARILFESENSMLCLVGSQVALIQRHFSELEFPRIVRLHFAGGRFPQEHLKFLHKTFPNAKIYNNFGCAEAMPRLTLRRAEDSNDSSHIGFTIPGVEMKSDERKQLLFRSPYRAIAYIDDSGFNLMPDEMWLPTGDLGEQLPDGGWRLLGRSNDVFKRHGEKISLPQILTTVNRVWDGDSAVYLEQDPSGEQGCVLVLSPEPDKAQLRDILLGFRKNHRRPHWPLRIESTETMPSLANGKTDILGLATLENKKLHWRQRI